MNETNLPLPNNTEKSGVVREIEANILRLDNQLKKTSLVSEYVKLLIEKRQYQELQNTFRNENV